MLMDLTMYLLHVSYLADANLQINDLVSDLIVSNICGGDVDVKPPTVHVRDVVVIVNRS